MSQSSPQPDKIDRLLQQIEGFLKDFCENRILHNLLLQIKTYLNLLKFLKYEIKNNFNNNSFFKEIPFSWNNHPRNSHTLDLRFNKDCKQCVDLVYYSILLDDKTIMDKYINNANFACENKRYEMVFDEIQKSCDTPLLKESYQYLRDLFKNRS
ncbi:MAG: hypothetical protein Fur006_15520 [Coleofasciculaceae cyanobacterium]